MNMKIVLSLLTIIIKKEQDYMSICINGEYFNNDLDDGALYVGYEIGYDKDGAIDYFWPDEKTEFYDEAKHYR